MKILASILIIAGICLLAFRGFNTSGITRVNTLPANETVRHDNGWWGWPSIAGIGIVVAGIALLIAANRKKDPKLQY